MRLADWEEGVAASTSNKLATIASAEGPSLRWVGREPGSGARQCQDELLGQRRPHSRSASNHRGVAEAIRSGWADVGVCLRLAAEDAGLDFLGLRREPYDLCFPSRSESDPRIRALVAAVQSSSYRQSVAELPGYDTAKSGDLRRV